MLYRGGFETEARKLLANSHRITKNGQLSRNCPLYTKECKWGKIQLCWLKMCFKNLLKSQDSKESEKQYQLKVEMMKYKFILNLSCRKNI